jgi:hypothetical protein
MIPSFLPEIIRGGWKIKANHYSEELSGLYPNFAFAFLVFKVY